MIRNLRFVTMRILFLSVIWMVSSGCDQATENNREESPESEMKSLGVRGNDVLSFELSYKVIDSKLYWILEGRQTVHGPFGYGGESGPEAEEIADKLLQELRSTKDGVPKNRLNIGFLDGDGFTIAETSTEEISNVGREVESESPSVYGWVYRGTIALKESESSRIRAFSLSSSFSDDMEALIRDSSEFLKKKKKERREKQKKD